MELIQPHKIKQEPEAIAVNDHEIYNKQRPIVGDKTDLTVKANVKLEQCKDTDQSMFSPHSIGQTMNPYNQVDIHPSSNEENKLKISNILTNMAGLLKVPQSDGNLIIKSTPTYHSRPYLREVVKFESESPPFSHLEGLKLDSSSVDLNLTAKTEQYIQPMINNNLKTSPFVFMKKEANTSPDECSHEEIDHSSDLCCDQQLLDDSISISTSDNIFIDNSFKKQNSMAIVLKAEEVKDYEDTNKVIKSNFSHSRQFQMEYSEPQSTQNTQVQKSFENSTCALGNSKDMAVITNKRKTYSKSEKWSETKRSPRRSARCLQRELKLGKSLVNSTKDDRENQQTQNSLGKNFIGENSSPKTVSKGSSRTSKCLTYQSKSVLLTNSKNTDNGSGDIEVDTLKDKSEESQVKDLKSRDKICQLKLKDKRYSALSSKTAKQVTKNILHQCQICNAIFKNVEQLRYHVVKHLKTSSSMEPTEMGYSCSICQSVLPSVKCFNEHLQGHDSDILKLTEVKPKEMLKCKICFLAFYGNVTLNAHQKVHEFTKWNPPSIENFRKNTICYFCGKESRDITNLKVHLRIHTGEKPHKCTQCAKTFACQSSLTKHLASHKETKDHVCDVCGKAFRLPSKLKRHRKIHFKNIFNMLPCLYCDKTFMRRSEITEHEKSFHFNIYDENKAKTQCPNCLKYIVKRAFKEHCKTHLQRVRSFHCETCKKSFLSRKMLLKHAKSHAADRKYICEYCGKIYMDKSCFTKHTLDHSKTKSFSCVCGLELISKNLLNAHKLKCPFKHACVRRSPHIDAIEKVYTKNKYSQEKLETNKKECPICYKLVSSNYFLSAQKNHKEKKLEHGKVYV